MCWSNIKPKNTFFILTNISVVLHNFLQCVWIKHFTTEIKFIQISKYKQLN